MIRVIKVQTKKEFINFINFPNTLYKNNPYYVPAITKEELNAIMRKENPVYNNADAEFYLAYKDNKIVGRIAAIVNWIEIKEIGKPKVRFGWFDVIDDIEVTKILINTVIEYGKTHNLKSIEGPVGFSNMDKAGLLTKGFNELNTMITWYNAPYYKEHLYQLGFLDAATWVEYKIDIPTETRPKVVKVAQIIQNRYKLKPIKFKNVKRFCPI